MPPVTRTPLFNPRDVIAIIMGGGAGTRLFPLTKDRSKPAVPLAGKYRLVDIPISNCINSELKRIFLLTQFQSSSLHRHIQQSYFFDPFSDGFVEIMAAQQTAMATAWYQGTADAVRQNLTHFENHPHDLVLILSGDQLYRMDFRKLVEHHRHSGADLTVATIPVTREPARDFGIMHIDADQRITRFVEKPKQDDVLDTLKISEPLLSGLETKATEDLFLASMGIYVFNRKVLHAALAGNETDFGKHIIPGLIENKKVSAFVYEGYWEDIGTISAFYEANLALTDPLPPFDFYNSAAPIYTHPRYLPASKVQSSRIERAILAEGCIIEDATISRSLIGIRTRIESGATVTNSIIMGLDYYETDGQVDVAESKGLPPLGIGKNTVIERTIVDKNARIGANVRISPEGKPDTYDGPNFFIRDGIVIIPKGGVVQDNTVI